MVKRKAGNALLRGYLTNGVPELFICITVLRIPL